MESSLQQIQLNFSEDSLFLLNLSLAFIMFGVALGLERKKFIEITRNPKGVFFGIAGDHQKASYNLFFDSRRAPSQR